MHIFNTINGRVDLAQAYFYTPGVWKHLWACAFNPFSAGWHSLKLRHQLQSDHHWHQWNCQLLSSLFLSFPICRGYASDFFSSRHGEKCGIKFFKKITCWISAYQVIALDTCMHFHCQIGANLLWRVLQITWIQLHSRSAESFVGTIRLGPLQELFGTRATSSHCGRPGRGRCKEQPLYMKCDLSSKKGSSETS